MSTGNEHKHVEIGRIRDVELFRFKGPCIVSRRQIQDCMDVLMDVEHGIYSQVIDSSQLKRCSLAFLRSVMELAERRRRWHQITILCGLSPDLQAVLHVLDPNRRVRVYRHVRQALTYLGMGGARHPADSGGFAWANRAGVACSLWAVAAAVWWGHLLL